VCFPSCPRHSARLLRACCPTLLHAPAAYCPARTWPASLDSLCRTHTRTAFAGRHAEQAHALGRGAPTCSVGDPVKVRPATDPACHCLPPPRLHTLATSPPRSWIAQPLVTQALFAPATALPAPRRTSCLQPLPVHTASPAARTSLGSRTGPSSMLSRLPLLLAGACRRSSSRVSHPLRRRPVRRRSSRRRRLLRRAPSSPGALNLPAARGRRARPP